MGVSGCKNTCENAKVRRNHDTNGINDQIAIFFESILYVEFSYFVHYNFPNILLFSIP